MLAWSDRGISGPKPAHHGSRPEDDQGPILRLLHQPESQNLYQAALVLTMPGGLEPAQALIAEMRKMVPTVELRLLDVQDPTDFSQLFRVLGTVLETLGSGLKIDVVLSAGTPQIQALWLILVQAGLLKARMLQVIPSAFVPLPHPKALREVLLDIDGFPEIRALREEVVRLRAQAKALMGSMVGQSQPMQELARKTGRLARADMPVLILGETGTGKELVARALHEGSARSKGPFIAENCGAFEENVLSSELFGHEKGSFTGSTGTRRGLFELAHGGTLFLDEVGELPLRVQAHLLRVLQEGELRRVGGEKAIRVDVRILAATHRDLGALVKEGRFREDLYYRLRGASLCVPPLRERGEDLELLVRYFLDEAHSSHLKVSMEAWRLLLAYRWPGNVRELRSEVMRWSVFCDQWVKISDLSAEIQNLEVARSSLIPFHVSAEVQPLAASIAQIEKKILKQALELCKSISGAARSLEIDRNTLKRKMRLYGIEPPVNP